MGKKKMRKKMNKNCRG